MPTFWRNPVVVQPYEVLADIYDQVMLHVDYDEWADFVELVLNEHHVSGRSLTEAACGTGTLAIELAKRGWQVWACDRSVAMVEQGRTKAAGAGVSVEMSACSMSDVPIMNADAVICLYDSVNYCSNLSEMVAALEGLRRTVCDGGLLIFDVSTHANSKRYFKDTRTKVSGEGFSYRRRSEYDPAERVQINSFDIKIDGRDGTFREEHRQKIYPLSQIESAIDETSWRLEACYDGFSLEPGRESCDRVHYVLRADGDSEAG
ncbi:MAG: class I SAM-dependent methyltransferase [Candidatus Latescibacteria bacterium]|jgi:ubiquinone/menaquinone biosynthesis C-methylase UbiE|nr:class I SAM-dependent methyltransferase [Candidatus Latescibacterota bacterium]